MSPRVTYDQFVRDLQPTYEPAPELATWGKFPDRFEPFHTVGQLVPSDGESPRVIASVHE